MGDHGRSSSPRHQQGISNHEQGGEGGQHRSTVRLEHAQTERCDEGLDAHNAPPLATVEPQQLHGVEELVAAHRRAGRPDLDAPRTEHLGERMHVASERALQLRERRVVHRRGSLRLVRADRRQLRGQAPLPFGKSVHRRACIHPARKVDEAMRTSVGHREPLLGTLLCGSP